MPYRLTFRPSDGDVFSTGSPLPSWLELVSSWKPPTRTATVVIFGAITKGNGRSLKERKTKWNHVFLCQAAEATVRKCPRLGNFKRRWFFSQFWKLAKPSPVFTLILFLYRICLAGGYFLLPIPGAFFSRVKERTLIYYLATKGRTLIKGH